ncbi:MAG: DUF3343 domain-containing protein [Clostridia bacterium]|jgi:hypothetical protein|nr:DUF3343 domain-containing protein [Clostridia bacterium]
MFWKNFNFSLTDKAPDKAARLGDAEKGLVIFDTVEEAIKAEKIIKAAGYTCKLVAPPPRLRKGCDLALEINLMEQGAMEKALQGKVIYNGIHPLNGVAELLNAVKVTNYDEYVMVKAGNMKLVFAKKGGLIVNTSGGGCPDIPYLNIMLVGQKLSEAPRPREMAHTLCGLMLDRAFEVALNIWEGGMEHAADRGNRSR